jgi:hypothetical protein
MIFKIVNKFIFNNNYIKFNNNLKITLYLERDNSILPSRSTQEFDIISSGKKKKEKEFDII